MTFDTLVAELGPVGWWKLADRAGSTTAADSSGGGHPGTVHGGVTFGQPGPLAALPDDTAASFDGTSGYVRVPPSVINGVKNFPLTFAAWVKTTGPAGSDKWTWILGCGQPGITGVGTFWGINFAGQLNYTSPIGTNYGTAGNLYDGQWHFVATTIDASGNLTHYIDGQKVFTAAGVTPPSQSGTTATIGQRMDNTEYFPGSIAQVAIFASALTGAQAADLWATWQATTVTFTPPTVVEVPPVSVADRREGPSTRASNPLGVALMRHYASRPRGVAVFKMADGTYRTSRPVPGVTAQPVEPYPPTPTVVNDALAVSYYNGEETVYPTDGTVEVVYYGGHVYQVDGAEADDLRAAGFGAYLT